MKLYALAIGAKKVTIDRWITRACAMATIAASDAEAIGLGIQMAREEWPVNEEWQDHYAAFCEIPTELIAEALEKS